MKQHKETNEEIRKRLKVPHLDGRQEDAEYALKIMLGFEPLDDTDEILKKLNENNQKSTS